MMRGHMCYVIKLGYSRSKFNIANSPGFFEIFPNFLDFVSVNDNGDGPDFFIFSVICQYGVKN